MPTSHPARNEFDTLFVDHAGAPAGTTVLRTHTSPVQIRTMLDQEPPIYIVAPGPGVPPRHAGRHAHARVPPDRGPRHRPRHQPRPPRRHDRGVHEGVLRRGLHVAPAPQLLPVHRTIRRVRHPDAEWRVARARRLRHGPPQRPARRRDRPGGVERLRVRLRHRPHGQGTPRRRGPPRDVHRRHPLRRSSSDEDRTVMAVGLSGSTTTRSACGARHRHASSRPAASLGLPVEEVIHIGGRRRGHHGPRVRTERHPDAAKVIRVWVDAGDGVERHVWCGASNFARRRRRAARDARHGDARRSRRSSRAASSASTRKGCSARLASSASATTTAASSSCPPTRRSACRTATSPGWSTDVVLDLDVTRNRPDCRRATSASPATSAPSSARARSRRPRRRSPCPATPASGIRSSIVDGERCGRFMLTVLSGVVVGPSAAVDGRPPAAPSGSARSTTSST